MYRFIVCDDEVMFSKRIVKIIDSTFMNNNLEYSTTIFSGYNNDLDKIIKDHQGNKIYILDIEMKNSISGIDIARKIREHDWNSFIIMITSHGEMGYEVLKAQAMVLDFISKFDNYKLQLEGLIQRIIEQSNDKNFIYYNNKGTSYRIDISSIIYIVKEPLDRKCKVVTKNEIYYIHCTLSDILEKLDDNFYLTHRSCVVNINYIEHVDWSNGIIIFNNGYKIDLLARERKKGLKNYVNV